MAHRVQAGPVAANRRWIVVSQDSLYNRGMWSPHLPENLRIVRERIARAAERAGRRPEEVAILGATKGVPPKRIREAAALGLRLFGENRVQEARDKIPQLADLDLTWHMIGHLQTNKVRHAVRLFHLVESLDRQELARELEKRLARMDRRMPVLLEVNTSGEPSKYGLPPEPDALLQLAEFVLSQAPHLELRGLMTLGPYPPEEARSRRAFARLRELRDLLSRRLGMALPVLSMGMSEDFEYAVLEGATEVRLGRALFGPREP